MRESRADGNEPSLDEPKVGGDESNLWEFRSGVRGPRYKKSDGDREDPDRDLPSADDINPKRAC